MANRNFSGVGVALPTPFKENEGIDYNSLTKLLERLCNSSIDYIVTLGTTSETPTLSLKERLDLSNFVADKVKGIKRLIIGIGGNCTRRVLDDLQVYPLDKYDAILSVVPYYNKPCQEGIYRHFKIIANNSPLPVILYNIPSRTGVNMTDKTVIRLAQECENIIGIKEASGIMEQIENIIINSPEEFQVISGDDSLNVKILKAGGCGTISVAANVFPDLISTIISFCKSGASEIAENLNRILIPFYNLLFKDGNPAGVKCALSKIGLIENYLRLPLTPVNQTIEDEISTFININSKLMNPSIVTI